MMATLAGCAAPAPPAAALSFRDPACSKIAMQRMADAIVNQLEPALQVRVAQDAYANCLSFRAVAPAP